jgi:hypothetical protein
MDKILSITKKWPHIMSFKALVIFLLILTPAISYGAGEIYDNTGFTTIEYISPLHTSVVFYPTANGTIGSFDFYGGYQVNGGGRNVQIFLQTNSGTELDCFSEEKTATAWGWATYPTFNLTNVPMSGSQCAVDTGTQYKMRAKVDGSYTDSSYYVMAYGNSGYTPSTWFRINSGYSPPTDYSTRIIDFTPADGATLTGPDINFSLHAYVNPDDIGTYIGVKFTLHNIDQNVLVLSAFSSNDIYFLDGFNATTSGDFYYATSTILADGNYRLEAQLERSYLGGWIVNPFSPINEDISHQFIVGSSTFIGNMSQNGFSELQAIFASTTATSTEAVAQNCNPLGSFDVVKCGAFLFIPGGDYLNTTMKGLKDGVLTRVPWGYLTRTYNIWNASATTSLPSFTASVRTGPGDDMTPDVTTITIDPGDMIAGAGTLLDNTRDPIYNKNAKDVFGPLVLLVLAVSVIFTIVADLTGSHRHHADVGERQTKLS